MLSYNTNKEVAAADRIDLLEMLRVFAVAIVLFVYVFWLLGSLIFLCGLFDVWIREHFSQKKGIEFTRVLALE